MRTFNRLYKYILSSLLLLVLFLFVSALFFSSKVSIDYSLPTSRGAINIKYNPNTNRYQNTIYFDNYGFDPNELTVPIGTIVIIKNITNYNLNFQPLYGQPNQNVALSLGNIQPGASKSFLADERGIWQYEANHNPSIRGEIGVGDVSSYREDQMPNAKIKAPSVNLIYDDYGFLPNELRIKANTKIVLINKTTDTEPGPSNFEQVPDSGSINPNLNLGLINKDQSKTFVISQPGKWLLEDSYQPSAKAISQIEVY